MGDLRCCVCKNIANSSKVISLLKALQDESIGAFLELFLKHLVRVDIFNFYYMCLNK